MKECTHPATFDGVVFFLQTLLDAGFIFIRDENEAPPFLGFGVNGQLDGLNLGEHRNINDATFKCNFSLHKKKVC